MRPKAASLISIHQYVILYRKKKRKDNIPQTVLNYVCEGLTRAQEREADTIYSFSDERDIYAAFESEYAWIVADEAFDPAKVAELDAKFAREEPLTRIISIATFAIGRLCDEIESSLSV